MRWTREEPAYARMIIGGDKMGEGLEEVCVGGGGCGKDERGIRTRFQIKRLRG